jgi:hypothetical protein
LLREATALSRRIELCIPGESDSVVAGFRSAGVLSIYFGQNSAYHFDEEGRLRRAFAAGDLFRTQETTLARLTRVRTATSTDLVRQDLSPGELRDFLVEMDERLSRLREAISSGGVIVVGHVPADDDVLPDLAAAVTRILGLDGRLAPPFAGKR